MFKSDLKSTNVLVTGADGFLGKHLIKRLIKEKANVTAFSQFGLPAELKEKVNEKVVNIEDYSSVLNAMRGSKPEKIFHLAANISRDRFLKDADKPIKTNLLGTVNLLKVLNEWTIKYDSFVFLGTAEAYGKNKVPFVETQYPDPVSPYSISKIAVEMLLRIYWDMYRMPMVILRGFIVYGNGQGSDMLFPQLMDACMKREDFKMTSGEQKRDFVYVDDMIEAMILASTNSAASGEIFNISSGEAVRVIDAVKMFLNIMGNPVKPLVGAIPYRDNEMLDFAGDNSKAKKILGWRLKVSLEDGIRKTIDYYIKEGKGIK
jgi:UDP-glucose 4-epimerase